MKHLAIILIITTSTLFCIPQKASANGCQGCCSYHGGILACNINTGMILCNDRKDSPTCRCECLNYNLGSQPSSSGGGSNYDGNAGKTAAIATGAALGALALGGMIYAIANAKEVSLKKYYENAQKQYALGQFGETSGNFIEGRYVKRQDSCKWGTESFTADKLSEHHNSNITIDHSLTEESKTASSLFLFLDEGETGHNVARILKDNTIVLYQESVHEPVCFGSLNKETKFTKMYLYCKNQKGKTCQLSFVHETVTAEYRKKQRELKKQEMLEAKKNEKK